MLLLKGNQNVKTFWLFRLFPLVLEFYPHEQFDEVPHWIKNFHISVKGCCHLVEDAGPISTNGFRLPEQIPRLPSLADILIFNHDMNIRPGLIYAE